MYHEARDVILALSNIYKGDWFKIYEAIKRHETSNDEFIEEVKKKTKSKYITILDEEYPKFIKDNLRMPPFVLYYYGDFSLFTEYSKNLAIYGCENPSNNLCDFIENVISNAKNINIVSSLHKGINNISLELAIKYRKKPIVIMSTGIDYPYPYYNKELYEEVKLHGLVISEIPGDIFPSDGSLMMANRITGFISKGLWFPRTDEKTPKNILFNFAIDYGKEIYACPQDLFSGDNFLNELIQAGATPVLEPNDIILDFEQKN